MRFFSRGNAVSLEDLERQFPNATAEECRRFHKACKRDAAEKIGAYLEWREKHNLDSLEESTDDSGSDDSAPPQKTPDLNPVAKDTKEWNEAVQKAVFACQTIGFLDGTRLPTKPSTPDTSCDGRDEEEAELEGTTLDFWKRHNNNDDDSLSECSEAETPKPSDVLQCSYIPFHTKTGLPLRDMEGYRVMVQFAGKINTRAASYQFYTEVFSLFIDQHFKRDDNEEVTVFLDCRPGPGWPNVPALGLVGFIRAVVHQLYALFPQRMRRCIIYPVPRAALYLWRLLSAFLDPELRDLMILIPGPKAMSKYIDDDTFAEIEKVRERALNDLPKNFSSA